MTLREYFQITRPLVVLDCETTGLKPETDRIIEIGFQMHYPDERPVLEWRTLMDPGIPISKISTTVHNIRDEDFQFCAKCGQSIEQHPYVSLGGPGHGPIPDHCLEYRRWPRFDEIAANLARGFTDVDYAGKNVRFDLRILAAEMARAKVEWSYTGARILDADRIEQLGDPRTLSDLYRKHLGREPHNAHQALADVRMTTEILEEQVQKYQMPRSLSELHELQWPGWLCDCGRFAMVQGIATCMFGKWRGLAMREIEPGYWDWILNADFPADVKMLAREAKLGRFPEVKR